MKKNEKHTKKIIMLFFFFLVFGKLNLCCNRFEKALTILVGTNVFLVWFNFFLETEIIVHISLYFPISFFFKMCLSILKLSNHNHLQVFVCLFSHLLCSHTFSVSKRETLVRRSTMEVRGSMKLVLQQSNPLLQQINNLIFISNSSLLPFDTRRKLRQ